MLADVEAIPQGALVEEDVKKMGLIINQEWEREQSKLAAQPTPSEDSEDVGGGKDSSSKNNSSGKNDLSFIAICIATFCHIQVFLKSRH